MNGCVEKEILFEKRGCRFLIRMEESADPAVYGKFEKLRYDIWGDPDDHLAGGRNLACENYLDKGGSLFISVLKEEEGAFDGPDALVGFSYGFVGVVDKAAGYRSPGNFRFYSQYTAVKKEFQGYGLGIAIKEFQRDVVLNLFGIETITCTFDPLVSVNAYRNIRTFGMTVQEYKVACYANYTGYLNRLDIDCDRFFMLWDLRKPYPPSGTEGSLIGPQAVHTEFQSIRGKDGPITLPVVRGTDLEMEGDTLSVEIPCDFYSMLQQTDVEKKEVRRIPADWRNAARDVFLHYLAKGWAVTDFIRDRSGDTLRCYYILKPEAYFLR